MSEMVERVAKAICNATREFDWDTDTEMRGEFLIEAQAAISAMREPTDAMKAVGFEVVMGAYGSWATFSTTNYQTMIDEALK